ncbi:bifunctional glutamate N-acetyltransferase/amino-acid acetyltransferase ArgJ [Simiduia curdlanivorans]|uniref:Arginine biosynthesis bifunctional protein ArgJ n=1 Tax=Simiduia curdlanivorans TaxID=1492769 RepID=A0ABV8V6X9_9GAMM|nr:bifunctional glutamate N-acetyltransferase/amino-acid acetyltransferase ArgJ [Simiduia curdlanivorans]MDN3638980.1 bifunctional glutamate N-acetyltransferase/amino-acid acetyltransferase ArgJ [Simiduia curdlanivorans]
MAVGEFPFPNMHAIPGFKLGIASAGIKRPGRKDVVVMEAVEGSEVVGVFTTNAFCAAPVTVCKERLAQGQPRVFITNTGNANACTGESGLTNAKAVCAEVARIMSVKESDVLPFSTGVIGEPLPVAKIMPVLADAIANLNESNWLDAGIGIMTTDTRPKGATESFVHQGETIYVSGIAKGSGMIKPNMATMLGYVATNAKVQRSVLQGLLMDATNKSFNRITVDGDTSTNDSGLLIATGKTNLPEITEAQGEYFEKLSAAVISVHEQLAKAIVTDGEGATKFVTVNVTGGADAEEPLKVAYAVAHSPLIKTALFASDPNWGRIVAAIGYAGIKDLDASQVRVHLGGVLIVEEGGRAASYTEEQGQAVMKQPSITIDIDLARGEFADRVWTTDLSHDYVTINADYRS